MIKKYPDEFTDLHGLEKEFHRGLSCPWNLPLRNENKKDYLHIFDGKQYSSYYMTKT